MKSIVVTFREELGTEERAELRDKLLALPGIIMLEPTYDTNLRPVHGAYTVDLRADADVNALAERIRKIEGVKSAVISA